MGNQNGRASKLGRQGAGDFSSAGQQQWAFHKLTKQRWYFKLPHFGAKMATAHGGAGAAAPTTAGSAGRVLPLPAGRGRAAAAPQGRLVRASAARAGTSMKRQVECIPLQQQRAAVQQPTLRPPMQHSSAWFCRGLAQAAGQPQAQNAGVHFRAGPHQAALVVDETVRVAGVKAHAAVPGCGIGPQAGIEEASGPVGAVGGPTQVAVVGAASALPKAKSVGQLRAGQHIHCNQPDPEPVAQPQKAVRFRELRQVLPSAL